VTMSTVILNQQFSPALGRSECSIPKQGRRELFFFEGSRQLGNCEPRGLMGVFNFGATLSGVGATSALGELPATRDWLSEDRGRRSSQPLLWAPNNNPCEDNRFSPNSRPRMYRREQQRD
jgi:hypothetical protein